MNERRWDGVSAALTLLKVFGAFLAGLVIVMGAAIIHSRAHEFGKPLHAKANVSEREPAKVAPEQLYSPEGAPVNGPERRTSTAVQRVPPAENLPKPVQDGAEPPLPNTALEHPPTTPSTQPPASKSADAGSASNGWPVVSSQQNASSIPAQPPGPQMNPSAAHPAMQQLSATQNDSTVETAHSAVEQPIAPQLVPPQPKNRLITVQAGTRITVRLAETLATDRNRTGDTFRGTLAAPLVANAHIVAESGATVLGRVINAHKAPLLGGRAVLVLAITDVETKPGGMMRVDTSNWEEKGAHSTLVNTAKMATGAAVGAVVGAVAGAAEGAGLTSGMQERDRTGGFMATKRTIVLPAGTPIDFVFSAPFIVTEKVESN